jgi:hypothetical protein
MHEELKEKLGIEAANCRTCCHFEDVGDGPEYNGSWLACGKIERMSNLKSFPFKKDMKCWEPEFWCSKFAHLVDGTDEGDAKSVNEWRKAMGMPAWDGSA